MTSYNKIFAFRFLAFIWLVFSPLYLGAQVLPDLNGSSIEQLSDDEITDYWNQLQSQGYTIEQIKSVALLRGYSESDITMLEQRIQNLNTTNVGAAQDTSYLELVDQEPFGLDGTEVARGNIDSSLFGYDFFNNDNITFTPNLNLSTPKNYQLGPGDELSIIIWGAAEQTYQLELDREGSIRIDGVGPIYLGGLDIDKAKGIISQRLGLIYSGFNSPTNSPYKVNIDITLVSVRSVQVDIIGEVKVPGTYTLSALSTVLNGLYASGGPTTFGTFREIKLIRDGETVAVFDVYKYLLRGSQEGNLTLKDRDVIIVSPYLSRIKISGSVKRPGLYEIMPDENILDLFTFTSGFASNAYKDLIILERIEGDRKVIKEIAYNTTSLINLKDGDAIFVRETIDKFVNKVNIEGAVYRPGQYELTPGLKLSELIIKAASLKESAFLERGILLRTEDGVAQRVESFSVSDIVSGVTDITLQPDDTVRIYDNYSLTEKYSLTIDGAVNEPATFVYMENMTVEDLVIMAGGFTDGANPSVIDIFRLVKDDQFETLSENFKVTSGGGLITENGDPFYLMPNDKVSVRYLKGANSNVRAIVVGEVNYPGTYSMESKGARISDLVELSGGLSPYAFTQGASLIRLNPYFKGDTQNISINELNDNLSDSGSINLNNRREYRVGIDLGTILEGSDENSKFNLVIQNGDRLIIPSLKETIKVEGEILVPSMVRYDNDYSLIDYINRSGGFSLEAKRGKTYVIYSNGEIASTKRFLFFKSYPKLRPGAIILVPQKPSRRQMSTQEVVSMSTSIVALSLLIESIIN